MKKKQFRSHWLVLILLVALLIGAIRFVGAKYFKTISYQGSITFSASLAEKVTLQEHRAVRQSDGTYVLYDGSKKPNNQDETYPNETVSANAYTLVPGADIPKDPHIVIEGKTQIPAYLYVEIVDTLDQATVNGKEVKLIDYSVSSDWKNSTYEAKHGGTVYEYTGGTGEAVALTDTNAPTAPIGILANNEITVSQYVKSYDIATVDEKTDEDFLEFYVYLVETAAATN